MRIAILSLVAALAATSTAHAADFPLDKLDLSTISQDWGEPHADKSVDNHPLTLGGHVFNTGIGTHANSEFDILLDGHATEFGATAGVDDETEGRGSVVFSVIGDGRTL